MNELQKLNCPCVQVDRNSSYSTDWSNVSKYKYLRITVYSEAVGHLHTVFSIDGVERGIVQTFKISPNKWETFKTEVLCNYMKFEFVNGPEMNPRLLINVLGRYGIVSGMQQQFMPHIKFCDEETKEVKKEEVEQIEEIDKKENHSKSPFRKFVERKKNSTLTQKSENYDSRFPGLILRGSMLVANQTNQLTTIPGPQDTGEYVLVWSKGQPSWKLISEFSNNWQI